jgi:Ca-activated chloride channel family protein
VSLSVTVTDSQSRLVPDLTKEDFVILDNGQPQQVTVFESGVVPFTGVVMLDSSASMTLTLDLLKAASQQFLIRMLPDDKAMVGAFNDKIEFHGSFTSDRDELIAAVKELDFGNATRLYDALEASIVQLENVAGRKVVVVFTDGDDTGSRANLKSTLDRAREKEVMVYAIGLESDYFNGARRVRSRPDRGLRRLADETGGGYFELKKTDELGPTFTRVAQELHSQYVLGFSPSIADGKVHKLAVNVKRPGMTARARKSYLAPGSSTSSTR